MASVSVTYSFSPNTTILSAYVNQNYTDLVNYINARNAGTTTWDGLKSPTATITNTSNQFVIGTTNTTTLSFTAPASSVVYTIPDAGGSANMVLDKGNYTLAGTYTLTGTPFTIQKSNSGANVSARIENQSNTASSGALFEIFSAGSSAGDAWTKYSTDGGSTKFFTVGYKNSDSKFHISRSATLGTNDALTIDSSSNVSVPNTQLQCGGNQAYPIVQVVTATSTTEQTTTSSTFTTTNCSASITPKFNTSKILIMVSGTLYVAANAAGTGDIRAAIHRDATNLNTTNGVADLFNGSTTLNAIAPISVTYYDSPATTSAVTYAVKIKSTNNSTTVSLGVNSTQQVITLIELAQ